MSVSVFHRLRREGGGFGPIQSGPLPAGVRGESEGIVWMQIPGQRMAVRGELWSEEERGQRGLTPADRQDPPSLADVSLPTSTQPRRPARPDGESKSSGQRLPSAMPSPEEGTTINEDVDDGDDD